VDFERGLSLLPDSKTGRKTIVLNRAAVTILQSHPKRNPFVIPVDDPERPRSGLKGLGRPSVVTLAWLAFALTICGTRLRPSARAPAWDCRSQDSCSATHGSGRRRDAPILMSTR